MTSIIQPQVLDIAGHTADEPLVTGTAPAAKTYQALHIADAAIRKVTFEALNLEDARHFATKCGFGLQGEVPPNNGQSNVVQFERADAFDVPQTCHKLGISRSSLNRLLKRGILSRLQDTGKVLVTRRSIERYLARAA